MYSAYSLPGTFWGRIHIDLNKNSVQTGCVYMAEILEKISLVFSSKRWHQKDILKLTDLYKIMAVIKNNQLLFNSNDLFGPTFLIKVP